MEENIIQLHITYEENPSFDDFMQLMEIVNESFNSALTIASIEYPDSFGNLNDCKFYVKGVKEGSIIFEFVLPILIGVATNVISEIIVTVIKNKFNKVKGKDVVDVKPESSGVSIGVSKQFKFSQKRAWTPKEEDALAKKAVEVYVNKKQKMDVNTFIKDPKFIGIIARHGVNSIRQKISNIRYILDMERPNGHTLEISPRQNCSKENIKAVKRYL